MAELRFTCPATRRPITSDFSVDADTYRLVLRAKAPVHCTHCHDVHEFQLGEGILDELPLAS